MSRWEHERTLTPVDGGTRVHDRVDFEPRLPLRPLAGLLAFGINAFFKHRQRRLQRFWAST